MGNKNSTTQLTKTFSVNGHDEFEKNPFDITSYQSSNGKKYGPSPRMRRRQTNKPLPTERKSRKSQVIISCTD